MEDVRKATRALSVKYARGLIIFYPKLDFLVGLLFDVVSDAHRQSGYRSLSAQTPCLLCWYQLVVLNSARNPPFSVRPWPSSTLQFIVFEVLSLATCSRGCVGLLERPLVWSCFPSSFLDDSSSLPDSVIAQVCAPLWRSGSGD